MTYNLEQREYMQSQGGRQPVVGQAAPSAGPSREAIRGISAQQPDAATCPCPTHISGRRPASPRRHRRQMAGPPIPADQSERTGTNVLVLSTPIVRPIDESAIDVIVSRLSLDKHGSKRNWNSVSADWSEIETRMLQLRPPIIRSDPTRSDAKYSG